MQKIAKLDIIIELNSLEKQNRRKRLEEKLRQQENYGHIEEFLDHLARTLNTNGEAWQAHNEKCKLFKRKHWKH